MRDPGRAVGTPHDRLRSASRFAADREPGRARLLALLAIGVLGLAGAAACRDAEQDAKVGRRTAGALQPAGPRPLAPGAVPPPGSRAPSSDPGCIGPFARGPGGPQPPREIDGRSYRLDGAELRELSTDPDDQAVLGVVADIKEDTPENLRNLRAIVDFFRAERAEAIVVDGDLGETEGQIAHVLEPLAASGLPVLAIIGNRDPRDAFNAAIAAVAATYPNLFNFDQIRLASLDDVALISMPGYFNRDYLVDGGCHYSPADVDALAPIVDAVGNRAVVLVSHGPPKQDGPEALDRTLEQANVGDPSLTRFIGERDIHFGIFANIHEAGGRATDRAGLNLVPPCKLVPELYLNAGPADAVRWTMNDRTESVGMAAVLTVKGRMAAFKPFRIRAT